MAKLGNVVKSTTKSGIVVYRDRTTQKRLTAEEVHTIIGTQRAQGRMASSKLIKAEQTLARRYVDKSVGGISYSEAKRKAHERVQEWLINKELYGEEEEYEEEDLSE